MNLYVVRHGQSVPNLERRHSGWSMLPLTEQGEADAKHAGALLKGIPFDRVYSSDLTRAVQTARLALGCEPTQLSVLRERSVGTLQEKLVEDCFRDHGDEYRQARAKLDFTAFGGENIVSLRKRAEEFLEMLESDPQENVAAFSHAGFIEALFEIVMNIELDRTRTMLPNASILRFVYTDGAWRYCFKTF